MSAVLRRPQGVPTVSLVSQTPTERSAGSIRAELARRKISGRQMGTDLGWTRNKTQRRLSGDHPLTIDELVAVARYLDIPLAQIAPGLEAAA